MKKALKQKESFMIIELLIVIAILTVLFLIAASSFPVFQKKYSLTRAIDESFSLIQDARSKTLASEGLSQYGVHFESNKTVLFKGNSFNAADPNNVIVYVPALIEIYSILLNGGGGEVIFEKLTGETNQFGTISFRVKTTPSFSRSVIINQSGLIDVQ